VTVNNAETAPDIVVVVGGIAGRERLVRRLGDGLADCRLLGVEDVGAAVPVLQGDRPGLVVLLAEDGPWCLEASLAAVRGEPLLATVPLAVVTEEADPPLVLLLHGHADEVMSVAASDQEVRARLSGALHRVRKARSLVQRGSRLEELLSRQSEFLSLVSHEIRTPLSGILSAANILMRYASQRPEAVERFARIIHEEGQRLTRLINDLLDLAKIEAGEVDWSFEEVLLADLFERVAGAFAALAREREIRLEVECPEPGPRVAMDRDKMVQVLANLVSNALKHTPAGGAVWMRASSLEADTLRLEVEDQGPGIPAGLEEEIFGRFRQLEGREDTLGTGLGLTISRQIVERHGGTLWAEPGRVRGARFLMDLPRCQPPGQGHGPVR
jgi:signal transduction histidine kinase